MHMQMDPLGHMTTLYLFEKWPDYFPPCLYSFTIPAMRVPISPQPRQHLRSDSDSSYPTMKGYLTQDFLAALGLH